MSDNYAIVLRSTVHRDAYLVKRIGADRFVIVSEGDVFDLGELLNSLNRDTPTGAPE